MTDINLESLQNWVGRRQVSEASITKQLVNAYRSTLEPYLCEGAGYTLPGLHWCLAPEPANIPMSDLGVDGHPRTGGFLPPVPLPRRMWAGGEVETRDALPLDEPITRVSTITDVRLKEGRSGMLCFVTVHHELSSHGQIGIRERQDIVYRDMSDTSGRGSQSLKDDQPFLDADLEWRIETPPQLLFRYSALTFNAHRIHYDLPYAQEQEGYSGLVVQGPLQASFLLNLASYHLGRVPNRFSYRGQSPLIAGNAFRAAVKQQDDGSLDCWTQDKDGQINMRATACQ